MSVCSWVRWVELEQVDQSPHGRDGHAPFFCDAKSIFKETLVLGVAGFEVRDNIYWVSIRWKDGIKDALNNA